MKRRMVMFIFLSFFVILNVGSHSVTLLNNIGKIALLSRPFEKIVDDTYFTRESNSTKILKLVAKLKPNDGNVLYFLGLSFYLDGDFNNAIYTWQQLSSTEIKRFEMLIMTPNISFGKLCTIASDANLSPGTLYLCGQQYVQKGDFNTAIANFKQAIQLSDSEQYQLPTGYFSPARNYLELGKAYYWISDLQQANKNLLIAEKLNSTNTDNVLTVEIYIFLGLTYQHQGELIKGEEYLLRAWNTSTPTFDVALSLGEIYINFEDWEKAVKFFDFAKSVRPEDVRPYSGLSRVYNALGNSKLAAEYSLIAEKLSIPE